MTNYISKKLKERELSQSKRRLTRSLGAIDFVSNDYLGLSRSLSLYQKIQNRSHENIVNLNGSTGSRLLAGNSELAEALEKKLAGLFSAEAALLFNSGYVANLGLVSAVGQRGDTILFDSLSHVCLKEGARLSKAQSFAFKHNDIEDLSKKLSRATGDIFVIIESVYSMDGDQAVFKEIIALAKKHNAYLIVDEAHGTGAFGTNGSGLVCELGIQEDFFARVYTFGKAMGVHGACVAGSQQLIDYLINFSKPFIYTTALPVHSLFAIEEAFEHIKRHPNLQSDLRSKIDFFNAYYAKKIGDQSNCHKLESHTAIQPIVIPGNENVKRVAAALQSKGFDIRPILSPTVKEGQERLRITLHTHNSENEIRELIDGLVRLV